MRRSRLGEIQDRFWGRVERRGPNECWRWVGTKLNTGYGLIKGNLFGKPTSPTGSAVLAHRVSWILANGFILNDGSGHHGWVVMHTCDNRECVNPAHLVLGSQNENIADMQDKGRARFEGLSRKSGAAHVQAALTAEQEVEVLATRDPARAVAARFGVDKSVILRVRRQNMTPEERAALRAENYRKRYA